MNRSRALLVVCLVALLHGAFFIAYQRPDWATEWSDQDGYKRLAEVLSATGQFTRYPDSPTFVPEVLRTPAYPAFVALVYKVAGVRQLPVAVAQTFIFAAICVLVFAIAEPLAGATGAFAAAMATALFSPLPYFGALVMTELWTAFLFTAGMWACLAAIRRRTTGAFALAGLLFGIAALSRPVFFLFPLALAMVGLIVLPLVRAKPRPSAIHWAALVATSAITLLPWFTYNYVNLGRFTMSPAGGVGRGIFEGSWVGTWSGRLESELTNIAEDAPDRQTLDARVVEVATREHLDPGPMLEYVHQWGDIRRIWTEPADPLQRAAARVEADKEYLRVGLNNIRRQSTSHVVKRLARGIFILWAGEIPFRYSSINRLPPLVIRACWAVQAGIICAAVFGLWVLARSRRVVEACLLASPIVYVTAVHAPLFTEARQSLPAMPTLLVLATIGVMHRLVTSPRSAGS